MQGPAVCVIFVVPGLLVARKHLLARQLFRVFGVHDVAICLENVSC
jgi:hypothetical protein